MKILIIGRSQEVDVVINDQYVSRRHMQMIIHDNGKVSVKDLGSKTGTYVNGKKIFGEYFLRGNDQVKVGTTIFPWQRYINVPKGRPMQKQEDELLATKYETKKNIKFDVNDFYNNNKTIIIAAVGIVLLSLVVYFLRFYHSMKTFDKVYEFDSYVKVKDIFQTDDDGYVICGVQENEDDEDNSSDALVVKINNEGKKEWTKTYSKYDYFGLNSIIETSGGYIACGYVRKEDDDGGSYIKMAVIKIGEEGEKIWYKDFGSKSKQQSGMKIIETNDGGYLIGGKMSKEGRYDSDIILRKIDEDGKEVWKKRYGGKENEDFGNIIETDDAYVFIGTTESKGKGGTDYYFLEIDKESGDKNFSKTYGTSNNEFGADLVQTDDDGFLLLGTRRGNGYDALLIKINKEGEKIWKKKYGGKDVDSAVGICEDGNGYVIGGSTSSDGEGYGDAWLFKVDGSDDAEGEKEWERTYGGEEDDGILRIKKTSDGGFVLLGYNNSEIEEYGFWVLKLNEEGKKTKE